jgi:site-specific recombinase XerD
MDKMKASSYRIDIHDSEHRLVQALHRLENAPQVCPENRASIKRFVTFCRATNLSVSRQLLYLQKLTVLAELHKAPFDQASRDSIVNLMDMVRKKGLAEWTYHTYCVTIKKFYKWLRGTDEYPPEVRWLKASVRNKTTVTADKLLNEQEIRRLIEVAQNHRDRAFVHVLYETGCRSARVRVCMASYVLKNLGVRKHTRFISVLPRTGCALEFWELISISD